MGTRKPPYLALSLVGLSMVCGHLVYQSFSRKLTRASTIDEIVAGRVKTGQAVRVLAWTRFHPIVRAAEFDRRDPKGERPYRYTLIFDKTSGQRLAMLYFRTTFLDTRTEADATRAEFSGTVRGLPTAERRRLLEGMAPVVSDPKELAFFLDEMEFPSVSAGTVVAGIAAVATLISGLVLLLRSSLSRRATAPAARSTVATAPSSPRAGGAAVRPAGAARPEKIWTCAACGAESPIASKNCSVCRAPMAVEYYVAAALPFEGFERYVPVISATLQVSDYQARTPLARVHTPVPYLHLDGFQCKGGAATAPFRLASRGIGSLVTARALAAALVDKGVEAVLVGSDELARGPYPRKASGLRHDDESVSFLFESGGETQERTMPWRAISLVMFSAAVPVRGTMTLARDLRESGPADPSAYLIDVYQRDDPEGIRIAADGFHRWEFLKLAGSERPADRFGKLMELLEARARSADLQYLTGLYRGPATEWRMNFYSRFAWLTGDKAGWVKQEGPPKLEGYEVLEKVGEGGMGSVYRGRQKKLGRVVALKVIAPHLAAQPRFVARFQAEARAVAALDHPNIVQVIDLAESAGRHFMVMEFVEGITLQRHIKVKGRLPEVEAWRIGVGVARALDHAARRGILHRDVKPENIFLTAAGEVKLADWGLAKDLEQDLGLTDTGTAVGTPYYMSPEQTRALKDLDARSDLYSLGATLYHAMTGAPPFRGGAPAEVLAKHLSVPAPDPRTLNPMLGDATAALLLRLLAKRPDERPKDGEAAIREIEHAITLARAAEVVLT